MKMPNSAQFKEQLKPLLFVLILSAIGFLLNLFPIPLSSNINLILGNVAFVIIAMRFGVLYSVLAALIVSTSLLFSFGHPFGFVIYGLEAVFIALLRRKGWYVLYADLLYWFLIGMPITALLLVFVADMPQQLLLLTVVKQVFNGLLYSCLAGLIVYFFPRLFDLNYRQQPKMVRSLKEQLVYATTLVISFSLMMTSMLVTHRVIQSQQNIVEKNLIDSKSHIIQSANNYLNEHKKVIQSITSALVTANLDDVEKVNLLNGYIELYDDFNALHIIDSNSGKVLSNSDFSLSENTYIANFKQLNNVKSQQVNISWFEPGTELESDSGLSTESSPMLTVTSPYLHHNDTGAVSGAVLGFININTLVNVMPNNILEQISYVITDTNNRVVFASNSIGLTAFKPFVFIEKTHLNLQSTGVVSITQPSLKDNNRVNENSSVDYFISRGSLTNGWKVYVLLDPSSVVSGVQQEYLFIFALLILAFLISIHLAQRIGIRLTEPLLFILKQVTKFESNQDMDFKPLRKKASKEISLLYDEIQKSKQEVLAHRNELEQKVLARTIELQQVNEKLLQLAEIDSLTEVYNRGYFDNKFSFFQKLSHRNEQMLSVVLIDLDFFKVVNDEHGHLVGDQCLRVVSKIMKSEFCRETDVVARYGGEEFVILISGISVDNLEYKLEKLRLRIAEAVIFNHDKQPINITSSFGAVIAPASFSRDAGDWLKIADLCLYKAKESGRNNVKIKDFSQSLSR
ncbi:diguanylate cyclase [Colwelliaceae bacterium BS250]